MLERMATIATTLRLTTNYVTDVLAFVFCVVVAFHMNKPKVVRT